MKFSKTVKSLKRPDYKALTYTFANKGTHQSNVSIKEQFVNVSEKVDALVCCYTFQIIFEIVCITYAYLQLSQTQFCFLPLDLILYHRKLILENPLGSCLTCPQMPFTSVPVEATRHVRSSAAATVSAAVSMRSR